MYISTAVVLLLHAMNKFGLQAWDLINEPRCEHGEGGCPGLVQVLLAQLMRRRQFSCAVSTTTSCSLSDTLLQMWLGEMSTFLRAIDQNHMITVGTAKFSMFVPIFKL